jgi:hypothetical protein
MVSNDFSQKEIMQLEIIIQAIFCRLQSIASNADTLIEIFRRRIASLRSVMLNAVEKFAEQSFDKIVYL